MGSLREGQIGVFLASSLSGVAFPFAVSLVTSATLTQSIFQQLRGNRAGIRQSFGYGLSRPLDILSGALVFTFFYWLAFIFYLVPAFAVVVVFWPCMPVIVLERKSTILGLQRSRDLTKGRRGVVLGLQLLVTAGFTLTYWAEWFLLSPVFGLRILQYIFIGNWIVSSAFGAVMATVGYYYLRADREGVAPGDVAEIFG